MSKSLRTTIKIAYWDTFDWDILFYSREMAIMGKPFHKYQKYIPVKCKPRLSSLVFLHNNVDTHQFDVYA